MLRGNSEVVCATPQEETQCLKRSEMHTHIHDHELFSVVVVVIEYLRLAIAEYFTDGHGLCFYSVTNYMIFYITSKLKRNC